MSKILTIRNGTRKDVIIEKAASLYKTKSYTAASMRELAESLGVEAPSLYNHIGSKSELLQAICFKTGNKFIEQVKLISSRPGNIISKLEAIIRFHIKMMIENFDEVYVANHEWKHLPEPFLSEFLDIRRGYEKAIVHLIQEGIDTKELRSLNPYVAVLTILSAVRGLEFWQRNKKNVSQQVLENDMVNHLLNGLIK
jgi:AcrR family transcriptional regulator